VHGVVDEQCRRRGAGIVEMGVVRVAVAGVEGVGVAPPIARCSTRATRRTKTRDSNCCWMKVRWQVNTLNVSAGTLNPYLPKRTIAPAQMLDWLEEPDEADLA